MSRDCGAGGVLTVENSESIKLLRQLDALETFILVGLPDTLERKEHLELIDDLKDIIGSPDIAEILQEDAWG